MANYKLFTIMLDGSLEDAYYVQAIKENKSFSNPDKAFEYLFQNRDKIANREYVALPYLNLK